MVLRWFYVQWGQGLQNKEADTVSSFFYRILRILSFVEMSIMTTGFLGSMGNKSCSIRA